MSCLMLPRHTILKLDTDCGMFLSRKKESFLHSVVTKPPARLNLQFIDMKIFPTYLFFQKF